MTVDATPRFAKKVVSPTVVDDTAEKEKLRLMVTTTESYPPLPTEETIFAGNAPGKSSYANVTGKPSGKLLNIRTFFSPGNNLLILKKWHPDENLLKEDVSSILVWVKLHGVPITAFNDDGLSAIITKLGAPLLLDSYTSDINTPIGDKIDKIERQICEGKLRLLDNDGNLLVPIGIVESDSEVEVVFDETANLRISTSGKDRSDKGYGTNSSLEQWKDSYLDNDDYDPYDNDMYENHDLFEHLQSICDVLDITVHGRKKK
nr:ATPase, F1/V1/A1 complex, alpha/beta subunit, zinc knuckle CX2CX4HX4C [Tanacetum cinerariifolium]